MELLLGSHVREHGNRIGRLAAFELEPATRLIRRLIFSADGELGPTTTARALTAISLVHDGGEIELHPYSEGIAMPAVQDVVLLSRATRIRNNGRLGARLAGLEIEPGARRIVAVVGRNHWWSRRFSIPAAAVDCSTPGEIRVSGSAQAA
jgi:hypothetical protein